MTRTRPRGSLWLRLLRWVALVLVVCMATTAGMFFGWLQRTVAQVETNDPITVSRVRKELTPPLPGEAVNILMLGSDRRSGAVGDKGRSDTMLLVRLDPKAKSISMFSVPRDLRVEVPGHGTDRINTAYAFGGAPLAVKTFKSVTGLPVNHFMDVNFGGFVNIVDYLGGVYMNVDRVYYNPMNTGWAAIDLKAGYQRLNGRDALSFCRFRHDATGDFGRMVRQQMFIREVKRQAGRWENWRKMPAILKSITKNTISDISSLKQLLSLASLVLEVDTARIYQTHLVATGIMVNGASELEASPADMHNAVQQFTNPEKPSIKRGAGAKLPKKDFVVYVANGGTSDGMAARVAAELKGEGYRTKVVGDVAPAGGYSGTRIYATTSVVANGTGIADLMEPAKVIPMPRGRGTQEGITVVVGSGFSGQLVVVPESGGGTQPIVTGSPQDAAMWKQFAKRSPVKVKMPTAWSPGFSYDWQSSRTYTIPTGHGNSASLVVVGQTPVGGYWTIQEMRWTDPPAVSSPDDTRTIGGTEYMLFYTGPHLHMVSWVEDGTLYWVSNTLDDQLSNALMLALATSFRPVK